MSEPTDSEIAPESANSPKAAIPRCKRSRQAGPESRYLSGMRCIIEGARE